MISLPLPHIWLALNIIFIPQDIADPSLLASKP